jgi:hypothetical protein
MTVEQQYVSLGESMEHIQRHFSGAQTVGSKFFTDAQQMVLERAETELLQKFIEAQEAGVPAGRVVIKLEFPVAVGTDALVDLKNHGDKNQVVVVRDGGTPYQSVVTAIEASSAPETKSVTLIAGPYGPTGKWGIYTMFPGAEAPPFPNENQPEPVRQANEQFWKTHGFLATREEITSHPRADGQSHTFSSVLPKAAEQKHTI